jgi:hypothetical protein
VSQFTFGGGPLRSWRNVYFGPSCGNPDGTAEGPQWVESRPPNRVSSARFSRLGGRHARVDVMAQPHGRTTTAPGGPGVWLRRR